MRITPAVRKNLIGDKCPLVHMVSITHLAVLCQLGPQDFPKVFDLGGFIRRDHRTVNFIEWYHITFSVFHSPVPPYKNCTTTRAKNIQLCYKNCCVTRQFCCNSNAPRKPVFCLIIHSIITLAKEQMKNFLVCFLYISFFYSFFSFFLGVFL